MPQLFSQSSSSTSTTAPNFLPGQSALLQQLFAQYSKALGMGSTPTQSDKNALMTQINNSYNSMAPSLTSQLTAQGMGSSGNLGAGITGIDEARANAQEQGMSTLNSQAMQRWLSTIGMGPSMGAPFGGSSSSGTQTSNPSIMSDIGQVAGMVAGPLMMGMSAGGASPPMTTSVPAIGTNANAGMMPQPTNGVPVSSFAPPPPPQSASAAPTSFATPAAGGAPSGGSGGGTMSYSPFAPPPGSDSGGGGYGGGLPQFG
jgi:hypothetical protein